MSTNRPGPDEEISQEVLDFIGAIDDYKKRNNRPFPSWSEVLKILHQLGYRKGMDEIDTQPDEDD